MTTCLNPSSTPELADLADDLDLESLRGQRADLAAICSTSTKPPRHLPGEKFLKGPIPWSWLVRAFSLPGKALHVAMLLWREAGCRRSRYVRLCLSGRLPDGLNKQSARRGLRQLAAAGLVSIRQRPGRGLDVEINDCPESGDL
jgi:hypothetical protein